MSSEHNKTLVVNEPKLFLDNCQPDCNNSKRPPDCNDIEHCPATHGRLIPVFLDYSDDCAGLCSCYKYVCYTHEELEECPPCSNKVLLDNNEYRCINNCYTPTCVDEACLGIYCKNTEVNLLTTCPDINKVLDYRPKLVRDPEPVIKIPEEYTKPDADISNLSVSLSTAFLPDPDRKVTPIVGTIEDSVFIDAYETRQLQFYLPTLSERVHSSISSRIIDIELNGSNVKTGTAIPLDPPGRPLGSIKAEFQKLPEGEIFTTSNQSDQSTITANFPTPFATGNAPVGFVLSLSATDENIGSVGEINYRITNKQHLHTISSDQTVFVEDYTIDGGSNNNVLTYDNSNNTGQNASDILLYVDTGGKEPIQILDKDVYNILGGENVLELLPSSLVRLNETFKRSPNAEKKDPTHVIVKNENNEIIINTKVNGILLATIKASDSESYTLEFLGGQNPKRYKNRNDSQTNAIVRVIGSATKYMKYGEVINDKVNFKNSIKSYSFPPSAQIDIRFTPSQRKNAYIKVNNKTVLVNGSRNFRFITGNTRTDNSVIIDGRKASIGYKLIVNNVADRLSSGRRARDLPTFSKNDFRKYDQRKINETISTYGVTRLRTKDGQNIFIFPKLITMNESSDRATITPISGLDIFKQSGSEFVFVNKSEYSKYIDVKKLRDLAPAIKSPYYRTKTILNNSVLAVERNKDENANFLDMQLVVRFFLNSKTFDREHLDIPFLIKGYAKNNNTANLLNNTKDINNNNALKADESGIINLSGANTIKHLTNKTIKNVIMPPRFSGGSITNVKFETGTHLRNYSTVITDQNVKSVAFLRCDLNTLTFNNCTINNLTISNSNIKRLIFNNCQINSINIKKTITTDFSMSSTQVKRSIINCITNKYDIFNSKFINVNFGDSIFGIPPTDEDNRINSSVLDNCIFHKFQLSQAAISDTLFSDCVFSGAKLCNVYAHESIFDGAIFQNNIFRNFSINNSKFIHSVVTRCRILEATDFKVSKTDLSDTRITGNNSNNIRSSMCEIKSNNNTIVQGFAPDISRKCK
tara:strand:+ start:1608 stop:4727 length:3120 start_codon:yes stop_codon:yes gene_type:complete